MAEEKMNKALRWVQTWKKAEKSLEKIRRKELEEFDYEAAKPLLHSMLTWAVEHGEVRETTGLQEQQALFQKLRKE